MAPSVEGEDMGVVVAAEPMLFRVKEVISGRGAARALRRNRRHRQELRLTGEKTEEPTIPSGRLLENGVYG